MQPISLIQSFEMGSHRIQLCMPETEALKAVYEQQKGEPAAMAFPYWARVWPSAMGLCRFLLKNTSLIQDKKVVELAAGLGLPSLLAAYYAAKVHCSDYMPEAVALIKQSIETNGLNNIQAGLIDWNNLPEIPATDILLLSDINYDPSSFATLHAILLRFLNQGTIIFLSTPQRLMAKPFIENLLPYCVATEEIITDEASIPQTISIFTLQKQHGSVEQVG